MNFDCVLIPDLSCEVFAQSELRSRFKIDSVISKGCVCFSASLKDVLKVAYFSQSAKRVLILLSKGNFSSDLSSLSDSLKSNIVSEVANNLLSGSVFGVECERIGEHEFNSVDAQDSLIRILKSSINDASVSFSDSVLKVYLQVFDDSFVCGFDVAGRDLSVRKYRVFTHPADLKGTIAFNFLTFAGLSSKSNFLDPSCLSGTIGVESALFQSCISPNFFYKDFLIKNCDFFKDVNFDKLYDDFDKLIVKKSAGCVNCLDASHANISLAKKNSKIAGVQNYISFSKTGLDDLDLKFEKSHKISIIASKFIEPSKSISVNFAQSQYNSLFNRSKEFLSKNGVVCACLRNVDLFVQTAKSFDFELVESVEVFQGNMKLFFVKVRFVK